MLSSRSLTKPHFSCNRQLVKSLWSLQRVQYLAIFIFKGSSIVSCHIIDHANMLKRNIEMFGIRTRRNSGCAVSLHARTLQHWNSIVPHCCATKVELWRKKLIDESPKVDFVKNNLFGANRSSAESHSARSKMLHVRQCPSTIVVMAAPRKVSSVRAHIMER